MKRLLASPETRDGMAHRRSRVLSAATEQESEVPAETRATLAALGGVTSGVASAEAPPARHLAAYIPSEEFSERLSLHPPRGAAATRRDRTPHARDPRSGARRAGGLRRRREGGDRAVPRRRCPARPKRAGMVLQLPGGGCALGKDADACAKLVKDPEAGGLGGLAKKLSDNGGSAAVQTVGDLIALADAAFPPDLSTFRLRPWRTSPATSMAWPGSSAAGQAAPQVGG